MFRATFAATAFPTSDIVSGCSKKTKTAVTHRCLIAVGVIFRKTTVTCRCLFSLLVYVTTRRLNSLRTVLSLSAPRPGTGLDALRWSPNASISPRVPPRGASNGASGLIRPRCATRFRRNGRDRAPTTEPIWMLGCKVLEGVACLRGLES